MTSVSAVFDFNNSLNDVAPVSPMLLSVVVKRNEKNELLMDSIYSGIQNNSRILQNNSRGDLKTTKDCWRVFYDILQS